MLYNGGKAWKAPTDLRDLLLSHKKSLENYQPRQQYFLLDAGRVPEETLAGNNDLATLLIRFERARNIGEIIHILTELCMVLPSSERLHLHRAFISWLGSNVFRRTEISEDILHCNTIQEARSMLADIAPHWEQNFMEKGIAIGKQEGMTEGIRNVLHDLLQNRFSTLPQDICTSIANMTDTNALRMLTREVYQVESLEAFQILLKQAVVSKN